MNRVQGFKDYIADKPEIKVVGEKWSEPNIEVAQAIVDDFFQAFPDMQFIYAAADGMAVGAANAARGANKLDQVVITTASFSPEGARYLQRGWIDLDIGESPVLEGAWALDVAVMALNGEDYPKLIYVPNPPFTKKSFDDPEDKKYFKYQWAEEGWKVPTF
jgi:ribose transport system substrate-binding protein